MPDLWPSAKNPRQHTPGDGPAMFGKEGSNKDAPAR